MARRSGAAARCADHGPGDTAVQRLLQRDTHASDVEHERRHRAPWPCGSRRCTTRCSRSRFDEQYRLMRILDAEHRHSGAAGALVRARSRVPGRAVLRDAADRREGAAGRADLPHGGWVTEIGPAEREAMWWSGLDILARLHRLDVTALPLGFLDQPQWGSRARPAARLLRALHELGLPGPETHRHQGSGLAQGAPARRARTPRCCCGGTPGSATSSSRRAGRRSRPWTGRPRRSARRRRTWPGTCSWTGTTARAWTCRAWTGSRPPRETIARYERAARQADAEHGLLRGAVRLQVHRDHVADRPGHDRVGLAGRRQRLSRTTTTARAWST